MRENMKVSRATLLRQNKIIRDQKGFSMVEMLLVLLLISIIVALASAVFVSSQNTSRDVVNIVRSEIDARLALYRISKDIREVDEILSADVHEVSFKSNVDADEYFETVYYYLQSEGGHYNLYRQVDSGTADLFIENIVDNAVFTYYTELGVPENGLDVPVAVEELANIEFVDIAVSIDQSGTQSLRTMELSTLITLRNRMY
jgi:prepilin-type N-terminal cleavage/methylation domain-containing protein